MLFKDHKKFQFKIFADEEKKVTFLFSLMLIFIFIPKKMHTKSNIHQGLVRLLRNVKTDFSSPTDPRTVARNF